MRAAPTGHFNEPAARLQSRRPTFQAPQDCWQSFDAAALCMTHRGSQAIEGLLEALPHAERVVPAGRQEASVRHVRRSQQVAPCTRRDAMQCARVTPAGKARCVALYVVSSPATSARKEGPCGHAVEAAQAHDQCNYCLLEKTYLQGS